MLGLLLFLYFLLYPVVTTTSPVSPTDIQVNDKGINYDHIDHTQPSQLQRREPLCHPMLGQNLVWADCIAAALRIPQSQEGVHYHYPDENAPGNPGIAIINTPLTTGGDPTSPYHLPRSWSHNGCMVILDLEPGLARADVTYSSIRYRATSLINLCVGGGNVLMPAALNHPGRGGNDTFHGVMIAVLSS